jgi:hypothetical protein
MHLMCDMQLVQFQTLYDTITLPPGYLMMLRWCLAELLMPQFGKASQTQVAMITANARKAKGIVKRMNTQPPPPARFELPTHSAAQNAGFILDGNFG